MGDVCVRHGSQPHQPNLWLHCSHFCKTWSCNKSYALVWKDFETLFYFPASPKYAFFSSECGEPVAWRASLWLKEKIFLSWLDKCTKILKKYCNVASEHPILNSKLNRNPAACTAQSTHTCCTFQAGHARVISVSLELNSNQGRCVQVWQKLARLGTKARNEDQN